MLAWATLLALPRPRYRPECESSDKGVRPNTLLVKAAAKAANVAKPAAVAPEVASPSNPVEAPSAASMFRDAMGAVEAQGTNGAFKVWCVHVD